MSTNKASESCDHETVFYGERWMAVTNARSNSNSSSNDFIFKY